MMNILRITSIQAKPRSISFEIFDRERRSKNTQKKAESFCVLTPFSNTRKRKRKRKERKLLSLPLSTHTHKTIHKTIVNHPFQCHPPHVNVRESPPPRLQKPTLYLRNLNAESVSRASTFSVPYLLAITRIVSSVFQNGPRSQTCVLSVSVVSSTLIL